LKRKLDGLRKLIDDLSLFAQYVDDIVLPQSTINGTSDELEKKYFEARDKAVQLIDTLKKIVETAKKIDKDKATVKVTLI
jgi:hypothetical protein